MLKFIIERHCEERSNRVLKIKIPAIQKNSLNCWNQIVRNTDCFVPRNDVTY